MHRDALSGTPLADHPNFTLHQADLLDADGVDCDARAHRAAYFAVFAAAGLDDSSVRRYEKGLRMPRKSYEKIVKGSRQPIELVEACHLPAVRAGRDDPWDVKPYGVWPLDLPTPDSATRIGGVAYDAARRALFLDATNEGARRILVDADVALGLLDTARKDASAATPVAR